MNEVKTLHRKAMDRTDRAIASRLRGDSEQALIHFREAYGLEARAALLLGPDSRSEPNRSILLRSAASLALDAELPREAEQLVCTALAGEPPEEIAEELRDLLEQVHFQRHLALKGLALRPEEFQLSIAGEGVGYGIAPTQAFLDRVEHTQALLYRTAERRQSKPYRDRGRRDRATEHQVQLFMTAPRAASFAVTFRIGGDQLSLPGLSFAEEVVDDFLDCFALFATGDGNALQEHIPDEAYYRNFLGLARNISPDGTDVDVVGFSVRRNGEEKSVALTTPRDMLPALLTPSEAAVDEASSHVEIVGQLREADSRVAGRDKITLVDERNTQHPIHVPSGMMSDIVKPLWDELVVVTGVKRGSDITLVDIHHAQPEHEIESDA